MRTLKKSLCLVLAVVMMFSLCVFGASADTDFDDYSEIEYTQAVDLLTTLGVITGYEDGTFGPDGTLTRAEACAIIARLLKNDDLTGTSDFTDVSSDHWAVNYIAYCASEGIVAGYGDGTFGPDDTLTGYAWMKMLLCAAGYNAEEEGMVGTTWEIGVATLAKDQDVTDDISGVSYGNNVSRDLACMLAYNMATKTEYVKWKTTNGGMTVITSDGTTVTQSDTGEYHYYAVTSGKSNDFTEVTSKTSSDTYATFLQYVWEAVVDYEARDDFGRPAKEYTQIEDIDVDITIAEDPEVTVSARTSASSFASLMSGYKFMVDDEKKSINNSTSASYDTSNTIELTYYVNGAGYTDMAVLGDGINLCEQLENLSANGKVIEFYDYFDADGTVGNDDVIDTIVIIEYSVGELTTCSTSGTITKYKVDGNSNTFEYDSDDPDGSDAFVVGGSVSKNDIVSYVVTEDSDSEKVMYIYPTTSVEGYFSTYSTGKFGSITVDGTRYTVGSGVYNADLDEVLGADMTTATIVKNSSTNTYTVSSDAITSVFGDTDEDITVYLDQFGYAVYGDEGSSSTVTSNYVYVYAVDYDDYDEGDYIWKIRYITTDGTTGVAYELGDGATQEVFEHYWYKKSNN
ncbi:MAG: S-layer homology domain-containing protein, partial [Oscillospiraceae bacterium]|nr:S-layer homology domain-containing protein [Oscillospiraceae bacterium]